MNQAFDYYLSILRNKNTPRAQFRRTAHILAGLLAQQTALHLKTKKIELNTPLQKTTGTAWQAPIMLVPVLRSGIALMPAFLEFFEDASVGVIGLKRDEKTHQAHLYYINMPSVTPPLHAIILDPMLATGGTACQVVTALLERGIDQNMIIFVGIVSAPEGIKALKDTYPHVKIITAACDERLNDEKFIVPGLGDFGDRYFGTE